ncbi:MAG: HNH endonuclease [Burkholderiaceae bacterium]|nr:HNH endonuclease [Burkholderiaceae bacterium]
MKHWWVNQNQTYKHEVSGGYLWSPKTNSKGGRNRFYDAMTEAMPGDVVFSFCDGLIKAIGIVSERVDTAPKPTEFGTTGKYWSGEGWYLPVEFTEISRPIRPKGHMDLLAQTLPERYSPLQANGNGNQGVYLAPVPPDMAAVLRDLLAGQVEAIESRATPHGEGEDLAEAEESRIRQDTEITETERRQLVKARIGQGLFRSRVASLESGCRLTGVTDKRMLRASHIKPWSQSENAEKLDGANGLMLAPHVDHLFDQGFISFTGDGNLIVSQQMPDDVIRAWGLHHAEPIRPLSAEQERYMEFHRAQVLRR